MLTVSVSVVYTAGFNQSQRLVFLLLNCGPPAKHNAVDIVTLFFLKNFLSKRINGLCSYRSQMEKKN